MRQSGSISLLVTIGYTAWWSLYVCSQCEPPHLRSTFMCADMHLKLVPILTTNTKVWPTQPRSWSPIQAFYKPDLVVRHLLFTNWVGSHGTGNLSRTLSVPLRTGHFPWRIDTSQVLTVDTARGAGMGTWLLIHESTYVLTQYFNPHFHHARCFFFFFFFL